MATVAKRAVFRVIACARVAERHEEAGRALIVGLHPDGLISFRPKGRKASAVVTLHVLHAYDLARRAVERAERARRKAARDKRRLEKMLALAFERDHLDEYPKALSKAPAKRATKPAKRRKAKTRTRRAAR